MGILYYFVLVLFLLLCAVTIATILVQESKGGGLGASFGGDTGDSLFGTSTADVLKRFTGYLVVTFFVSCVVLSLWTESKGRQDDGAPVQMEETIEA